MSVATPAAPPIPAELEQTMRQLKMPYARGIAPDVFATARAQRWEPAEVVKALLDAEIAGRSRSMLAARRKAAGFPTGKTFDSWDQSLSTIPAPTQQALRTLEWVHRRENLVICGPAGTGKTFFLEALGQHAVEQGLRVAWFRLEDLGALIRAHRVDDTVTRTVARILRADLVVVDDIGLLGVGDDAAEGLYRLVDAAYEKRSIAISSNLHPSGFDELMPKTLATATVDRLLHHAHLAQTTGESIRLAQAPRRHGGDPHDLTRRDCLTRPGPPQPGGQNSWPRMGSSTGHQRALPLAAYGQFLLAVDRRAPRARPGCAPGCRTARRSEPLAAPTRTHEPASARPRMRSPRRHHRCRRRLVPRRTDRPLSSPQMLWPQPHRVP
ncbi:IS21-like element helper ATPase IstB [Microbacterium aurum]|uniref:IS21-like element helper ATPase IstB n=1 Tax=Microbacterium aurum TaxID=36805 RepID=UPI0026CF1F74|nr:DNA replication protein DnaC [Microbacterium aurum]